MHAEFKDFERKSLPKLASFVTMTRYEGDFPLAVAFPPVSLDHTLGQTVSEADLPQLRIAETEKYAHVTYFLNCGREEPFPGEDRVMVPSPREVATYDLKPTMSAREVTDKLLESLDDHSLCVCNLANLDMVGHTGIIRAAIEAAECVDECVGRIEDAVLERGGTILLTADHGNAEEMIDSKGNPQTAHSTNPVRLVYIAPETEGLCLREGGRLGDIAPTALAILGLEAARGHDRPESRGTRGRVAMAENTKVETPVRPSGMEVIYLYPCPHCGREVPFISPTRPDRARCDACRGTFPIVPVDERSNSLRQAHDGQRAGRGGPGFYLKGNDAGEKPFAKGFFPHTPFSKNFYYRVGCCA